MSYDPLVDPGCFPVSRYIARCRAEKPIALRSQGQSNPSLILKSAFGDAVFSRLCQSTRQPHTCHSKYQCQAIATCQVPFFYRPVSSVQNNLALTPSVRLHSPELESGDDTLEFDLHITLWGRNVQLSEDVIRGIIEQMGSTGIGPRNKQQPSHRTRFTVRQWSCEIPPQSLIELALRYPGSSTGSLLIEFTTPFPVKQEQDTPDLGHILGIVARNVIQWDMHERQPFGPDNNTHYIEAAKQLRRKVEQHANNLQLISSQMEWWKGAHYSSRSNKGGITLQGKYGVIEYQGELKELMPWLFALKLGGGPKTSFGLSRIRFWTGQP